MTNPVNNTKSAMYVKMFYHLRMAE